MTDMDIERTERITEELARPVASPPRHNGGPRIDSGIENIEHAGELSAKALREAFEECAQRALDAAQANVEAARQEQLNAEKFAEAVRRHGDSIAAKLEVGFARASKMATSMAAVKAMITDAD